MSKIKLDFVQAFVDRHGKPRWYFRRKGHKRVPLPGMPGSPDFMAAYERAIAGAAQSAIGDKHIKPGTIDDLVARYFASAAFVGLPSEATRATYRGIIEGIRKEHGSKRLSHLRTEDDRAPVPEEKRHARSGQQLVAHDAHADEVCDHQSEDDQQRSDRGHQDAALCQRRAS
jgi:hypothetical protein